MGSNCESQGAKLNVFGDVFYPGDDTICTDAFSRFLREYRANLDFFFFVVRLVGQADDTRRALSSALLTTEKDPKKRLRYEKDIARPDLVLDQLTRHSTVQSRNLTNGIVNAFQRYFSAIINLVAIKRPEVISSSQSIKIEDILRFKKFKDLAAFIIDRKINELSYGGLADMEKYFNDRLGVRMFSDDSQREMLRLFVEVRNINVHNGGIVNDIFISRVGNVNGFTYAKGDSFHIDFEALVTLSENAMRVAMQIDAIVATKFRLLRKAHRSWKRPKRRSDAAQAEFEGGGGEESLNYSSQ